MARKLLGTLANLATRTRVYLSADAIEVDEIEGYKGVRKRVLLDEVTLITLDRRRSPTVLWVSMLLALSFGGLFLSLGLTTERESPAFYVSAALFALPMLVIFFTHLALGTDYVTVFGKRSMAQMAFSLRKGRARRTFTMLRERVAEAQEAERQRLATPPAWEPSGT